jgi:DNA-binding LacI/PurR family transcriptional regulator
MDVNHLLRLPVSGDYSLMGSRSTDETRPSGSAGEKSAKRPTMDDLAKLAGVSTITVSRALRGSPLVRAEVRTRIESVAREHGYRFNLAARSLRLQKSHTVAVVIAASSKRAISDAYPLTLLGEIVVAMSSAGYILVLAPRERALSPEVQAADGVILLGQGANDEAVHMVESIGTPLAVWGAPSKELADRIVVVGSDNERGGASAADHLLASDRHRLIFVGDTGYPEISDRYEGFAKAVRASGADIVASLESPLTAEGGYDAVKAALGRNLAFDGIFCASDLVAAGTIKAVQEAGMDVPRDVSIVGYDDSVFSADFNPPITTVRQDWQAGGALLVAKLLELIETGHASSQTLATKLIVRQT